MTSFSFFKYFAAFELDVNVVNFVYCGKTRMTACSKANHRVHSGLNFSTTKEMYFHNYGLICIERKTFSWCIKTMKRSKCTIFEKCNPVVKTSSKMD